MDYSVISKLCRGIVGGRRRKNPLPKTRNSSVKFKKKNRLNIMKKLVRDGGLVKIVKSSSGGGKRISAAGMTSSYFRPARYSKKEQQQQYAIPIGYDLSDKLDYAA